MKSTQIAMLIALSTSLVTVITQAYYDEDSQYDESTYLTRGAGRTGRGLRKITEGNIIEGAGGTVAGTGEMALGVATLGRGGRRYEETQYEKPQYKEKKHRQHRHRRTCDECETTDRTRFCKKCRGETPVQRTGKFVGNVVTFGGVSRAEKRKRQQEEASAQENMRAEETYEESME